MSRFGLLLLLPLLLLTACAGSLAGDSVPEEARTERLEITGRIVWVPLEGGFFGLVGDDGRQFEPLNLPEAFRRDGLPVLVTGRPAPPAVSFRMWGRRLTIDAIRRQ
jgi:inhibitor of cysteine peptidase